MAFCAHWGCLWASCWLFLPALSASVSSMSSCGVAGWSRLSSLRVAAGVRSIWSGFCLFLLLCIIMWFVMRLMICFCCCLGHFRLVSSCVASSAPFLSCPMAFCCWSHMGFLPMSCSRAARSRVLWSLLFRFSLVDIMAAASVVCRVCSSVFPSGWCSGFWGVSARLVIWGRMWCRVFVCIPARKPIEGVGAARIFSSSSYILSALISLSRCAFWVSICAVSGCSVAFRVAVKRRALSIRRGSSGKVWVFTARIVFVCRSCMPP